MAYEAPRIPYLDLLDPALKSSRLKRFDGTRKSQVSIIYDNRTLLSRSGAPVLDHGTAALPIKAPSNDRLTEDIDQVFLVSVFSDDPCWTSITACYQGGLS
jgi:hypothetical protein